MIAMPPLPDPHPVERKYRSFLLRFWQEEEGAAWRIQVEHPHTREVIGFATLERLMQFLDGQLSNEEMNTL